MFTSWRIDLTEHKLFTLSDGTKNILLDLEEPITLDFYLSQKKMIKLPQLANYAVRVRDMLEEYVTYADGKIILNSIDPESFSEAEDQAVASGLQGIPMDISGERAYFGLVGANSTDDEQLIPFFQPDREAMVEYDITKLIYNLAFPDKRKVGVAGSLPMFAGRGAGDTDWTIIGALREFFVVQDLGARPTSISQDIDVLLLAHPKEFSDAEYYALDQYLLKGGKAMIFIDPLAEQDRSQSSPVETGVMPTLDSYLHKILDHWGVTMVEQKLAADINAAMHVQARGPRGPYQIKYLPWLRLTKNSLNSDDFVTSELQLLHMGTAGSIDISSDKELTVTPLLQTSAEAMLLERDLVLFQPDPTVILNNFKSEDKKILLAARIQGEVDTAYPDGWPADSEAAADIVRQGEINIVLVSDTDILADHFWIRTQNILGNVIPQAIANNGDFVINSIEHLSGSSDLINLRGRGRYVRPFKVVDQIRKEAEVQFRKREQELQQKLKETEQMIRSLQAKLNPEDAYILGAAQSREIEQFRQVQLKTRKELRAVQHELQKNIERLGAQVRFINIGLVPLLIIVLALALGVYRSRRTI